MVGEKQKWPGFAEFLAHEQQRDLRREQQQRNGGAQGVRMGQAAQPFASARLPIWS